MQTAVCDSFVVLTHCILSFSQREKWVLYTLTAIRGAETFAHESIVSITVLWQLSDSSDTLRLLLCTFFLVASKVCRDIFPQSCDSRNLEYQGYIYHYENRSAEIFRIMDLELNREVDETSCFFKYLLFQQPLESEPLRLWLWLLLLKITAWHLLNQSVSVLHTQFPSTWKLSPTLAFCNVLSLKRHLLWVSINKKSDSTANKKLFLITEITHSVICQTIWTENDRCGKTDVLHAST